MEIGDRASRINSPNLRGWQSITRIRPYQGRRVTPVFRQGGALVQAQIARRHRAWPQWHYLKRNGREINGIEVG
jgi:hypothetical protein